MEETAPAVAIPAPVAAGTFCEVKNKPIRNHTLLKVWLCEVSPSRVGDLHFGVRGIADYEARARSAR